MQHRTVGLGGGDRDRQAAARFGAPEQHVLLERIGPPIVDADTAETIDTLIAKGVGGSQFLEVDDLHATFDDVVAKGADVVQEPMERFYGIDAAIRDDSGNQIRMTQRVETGIPWPESAVNG